MNECAFSAHHKAVMDREGNMKQDEKVESFAQDRVNEVDQCQLCKPYCGTVVRRLRSVAFTSTMKLIRLFWGCGKVMSGKSKAIIGVTENR